MNYSMAVKTSTPVKAYYFSVSHLNLNSDPFQAVVMWSVCKRKKKTLSSVGFK